LFRSRWFALCACLTTYLAACAPDVAETPHASLQALKRAAEAGDTLATLQFVDLDAIAGRLIRDVRQAAADSFGKPLGDDTLDAERRAAVDSTRRELVNSLRENLGLATTTAGAEHTGDSPARDEATEDSLEDESSDAMRLPDAEIIGDGAVRYVGDTALVERVVRYSLLDTTVTLVLALVPVNRAYWRIVAFHNAWPLALALRNRQKTMVDRANKPIRDTIAAYVTIDSLTITREPLEEWDRYTAEARATVTNISDESITVHTVYLVGPHLALGDTVGRFLAEPVELRPATSTTLRWRRRLGGADVGPYDAVGRPDSYTVAIADIALHGQRRRVRLHRSWDEYAHSKGFTSPRAWGVLASRLDPPARDLTVATVRRDR
jgi:hypothetical protein